MIRNGKPLHLSQWIFFYLLIFVLHVVFCVCVFATRVSQSVPVDAATDWNASTE